MARGLSIPRMNGLSWVWSFNMKRSLGHFTWDLEIYLEYPMGVIYQILLKMYLKDPIGRHKL